MAQEGFGECRCECPWQGRRPGLVRHFCPELPLPSAGSYGTEELGRPGFESYPLTSCVTLDWLLNLSVSLRPRLSHGVAVVKSESS